MDLEAQLMADLKQAMKSKDQASMRAIRALKAAILLYKTDGSGKDLDEAAALKLVQKQVKQRQDSLEIYEKQNREDLAQTEREEIEVLKNYLPKQLSDQELEAAVKSIIEETGAESMKDMGRVMGLASKQLGGKADGRTISEKVKALLSS